MTQVLPTKAERHERLLTAVEAFLKAYDNSIAAPGPIIELRAAARLCRRTS